MKRWNGWGDVGILYPLPETALAYLANLIGRSEPHPDADLSEVLASVPESRLPDHPGLLTDVGERLSHARGQSLPDWIALRSGRIGTFPDGVAYPESDEDIRILFEFARLAGIRLIPYGGGTSVVGHINPLPGSTPVLTVDLTRLVDLIGLDEKSRLATFGAGIKGPDLEAKLQPRGYTLGHFPQSFEYSTLGGWIATRSCGQQSYYYGRIETLFAGGHIETPAGPWDLPHFPASAAGPDLGHLFLGSEGRFGFITQVTVRVNPLPEVERFKAILFRDWPSGVAAVQAIAQEQVALSMLRLSDAQETETTLALAGRERLVSWADRGLRFLRYGPGRCLLIYGLTGNEQACDRAESDALAIARRHGGLPVGGLIGDQWRKNRFRSPYLRNTLWEAGYAVDTLETAVPWSSVWDTAATLRKVIQDGLVEANERVLILIHLSHVYRDGASIYVTYLFRRTDDPEETLSRWRNLKLAASQAIVALGGTISHQHGVGIDHAPFLEAEKGELGLEFLATTQRMLDPDGLLNPGKLMAAGAGGEPSFDS